MAYGVNAANGLVTKGYTLGSLPSSGIASQGLFKFNIKNGYGKNFGLGDPVCWLPAVTGNNGYIVSAADPEMATHGVNQVSGVSASVVAASILGVFAGCQYSSDNDLYQNLPMRLSWRAGTTTSDGSDPVAFVIPATYQAGFSVQTSINGCAREGLLQIGELVVPVDASNNPILNGDQSTAYLEMGAGGNGDAYSADVNTFQVIGFDDVLGFSGQPSSSQVGIPYGNVIVRIANSAFPTYSTFEYI